MNCICCRHPSCQCVQEDICYCRKCLVHCICETVLIQGKIIKDWPTGEVDLLLETQAADDGRLILTVTKNEVAEARQAAAQYREALAAKERLEKAFGNSNDYLIQVVRDGLLKNPMDGWYREINEWLGNGIREALCAPASPTVEARLDPLPDLSSHE